MEKAGSELGSALDDKNQHQLFVLGARRREPRLQACVVKHWCNRALTIQGSVAKSLCVAVGCVFKYVEGTLQRCQLIRTFAQIWDLPQRYVPVFPPRVFLIFWQIL